MTTVQPYPANDTGETENTLIKKTKCFDLHKSRDGYTNILDSSNAIEHAMVLINGIAFLKSLHLNYTKEVYSGQYISFCRQV